MFGLPVIAGTQAVTFFYILLRISGALLISPIFGRKNIPVIMRIGFCLVLSVMLILILPESAYAPERDTITFFINGIKEMLFGIIVGFVCVMALNIAVSAGQIIDMQIGFGLSNFFDAQLGTQVAITGNFLNMLMLLAFFIAGGHHRFIETVYGSFIRINPGRVVIGYEVLKTLFSVFVWTMVMIVQVAIPVMSVIIITEFALGIIMKAVPHMNFFVIGISLKIFIGLLILILFISAFIFYSNGIFDRMFAHLAKILNGVW